MPTKRPANDDAATIACAVIDELIDEAHADARATPCAPEPIDYDLAAQARARVARARGAAGPAGPTAPAAISRAVIPIPPVVDLAPAFRGAPPAPPRAPAFALGSQDGAPTPRAREPDTGQLARMSRAELVAWIGIHPARGLEADMLGELTEQELRDEARALRGHDSPRA